MPSCKKRTSWMSAWTPYAKPGASNGAAQVQLVGKDLNATTRCHPQTRGWGRLADAEGQVVLALVRGAGLRCRSRQATRWTSCRIGLRCRCGTTRRRNRLRWRTLQTRCSCRWRPQSRRCPHVHVPRRSGVGCRLGRCLGKSIRGRRSRRRWSGTRDRSHRPQGSMTRQGRWPRRTPRWGRWCRPALRQGRRW